MISYIARVKRLSPVIKHFVYYGLTFPMETIMKNTVKNQISSKSEKLREMVKVSQSN